MTTRIARTTSSASTTTRPAKRRTSGSILSMAMFCLAGASALGALFYASFESSSSFYGSTKARRNPTPADAKVWLVRAGLDPKALAAAGLNAGQTGLVVANVGEHLDETLSELLDTDEALTTARSDVQRLEKLVIGGMGSGGDVEALTTARAAVTTHQAALNGHLGDIRAAGFDGLEAGAAATTVGILAGNRSQSVPMQFMVENREEAQWVALRDALAAKRVHERMAQDVPGSITSIIAAATSNAVSTAASNLSTNNVATITTAWNEAVDAIDDE